MKTNCAVNIDIDDENDVGASSSSPTTLSTLPGTERELGLPAPRPQTEEWVGEQPYLFASMGPFPSQFLSFHFFVALAVLVRPFIRIMATPSTNIEATK